LADSQPTVGVRELLFTIITEDLPRFERMMAYHLIKRKVSFTLLMVLNCGLPLPSLQAFINCSSVIPTSLRKLDNKVSTCEKETKIPIIITLW